jgi:hypothetical protein
MFDRVGSGAQAGKYSSTICPFEDKLDKLGGHSDLSPKTSAREN